MRAVKVGVGGNIGVDVALTEEEELAFYLGNDLVPQAEGKSVSCAAEDRDKVVLPKLDCLLGDVSTVVVGRDELERHAGEGDGVLVLLVRLVVKDLVLGVEAGGAHAGEAPGAGGNH